MEHVTFSNGPIKMAGNLHLPKDFSKDRSYVAIVCVHPAGGVKEQTAGLYAAKLADEGMAALAYDASYQGESGGEPRQEEDPYARVEDIRAAVDYLTTLGFVDQERICVLGICSGGGYAINAAMTDRRIKAVGIVSAINLGAMYRSGYEGTVADTSQAFTLLEMAAKAQTAEAKGEKMAMLPFAPPKREEGEAPDYREAWEYYHTPRAQRPNAPSIVPVRCLARLVAYDAFHLADKLLTQPLRLIAGSKAGSLWFSQDAFRRAGQPRQEPAHRRGRDPHRHVRHVGICAASHGPARATLSKRAQGFVDELYRSAERAATNGWCGSNGLNSLRGM